MGKGVTPPHISLITLSRDNPEELLKTVRSVYHQTLRPGTYVVVDSSSEQIRPRMKELAETGGARYVWVEPEGIYPAMVRSLDSVPQNSYVWWINSSDWLAGPRSIQEVSEKIVGHQEGHVSWLVGQLIRLKSGSISFHDSGFSGDEFVKRMVSGQIGFPHPSSVFWLPDLKQISPFEDDFRVASDYATALRFAKQFGLPLMSSVPLSVHIPTGFSASHPVRNSFDKSRARWRFSSWKGKTLEPLRAFRSSVIGVFNLLFRLDAGKRFLAGQIFPLGMNQHFCNQASALNWPTCCDEFLEKPLTRST